jgi:hypothetical protein
MSLYYNKQTYELRDINDEFMESLRLNNNPKYDAWALAPNKPGDNYIWNNGQWIEIQNNNIPENISARQVRIWLLQHGISLQQVENAIDTIQDPVLRDITKVEWEYAPYIERNHPMLVPLAQALGLTQEQLDQAFIEAKNI